MAVGALSVLDSCRSYGMQDTPSLFGLCSRWLVIKEFASRLGSSTFKACLYRV